MSDTDAELVSLLAKLQQLNEMLTTLETEQAKVKEELAHTQVKADEVRREAERRKARG